MIIFYHIIIRVAVLSLPWADIFNTVLKHCHILCVSFSCVYQLEQTELIFLAIRVEKHEFLLPIVSIGKSITGRTITDIAHKSNRR